ncbi:MAG: magnesium transporter [Rhodospirillales bacterium]
MPDPAPDPAPPQERLDARLQPILTLLRRQGLVADLAERQSAQRRALVGDLTRRQTVAEIANRVNALAAADAAHLLEMLPPDQRRLVWEQLSPRRAGDALWEVSGAVADALVAITDRARLLAICRELDADSLGQIAAHLPADLLGELYPSLAPDQRDWVRSAAAFAADSVGRLMTGDVVAIDRAATVKDALRALRRLDALPEQTDQLFVVDARRRLVGGLAIETLLLHPPRRPVIEIVRPEGIRFTPGDAAEAAARAFERYDLVSAPVVDERGRLIGRVCVDKVMDFVRAEAEARALQREGLSPGEDLFGPVRRGARQRWPWLAINLLTAFLASRVIGLFEDSIEQLVALATLMPIVASVGGNTGNQTVAIFIRALALDRVNDANLRYLVLKEVGISGVNGAIWGGVLGLAAFALYGNPALGLVMAAATLLNLLVAALVGIAVPMTMDRLGRDPALGSSVLLTFTTDSMGFFIFLGLATVVLL